MPLRNLILTLALLPCAVLAHNLHQDRRVPAVAVSDSGELIYQQDRFHYQRWSSAELAGKVRLVQHIAGRSSAKEMNAELIEAIKRMKLPQDRYQTTTIINTDDAIPASGLFVRRSVENSKKAYPWAQFIVDNQGAVKRAWQLEEASSAIIVLDKSAHVRFVQQGALSEAEVNQVGNLLQTLVREEK